MKAEIVADGIPFAEGPVWCAAGEGSDEPTLVVTSVAEGALYRVWPASGRRERFADTGGGANGAALASDASILVTQNGGFDFARAGLFASPPPYRPATPGLQIASPGGTVRYLCDRGLNAPNDLVVAADGTVYFTDPGRFPPPDPPVGRVMALRRDGALETVASGFWYCNGIALDDGDGLVVVERRGLLRLGRDGRREWLVEDLGRGGGDGFCIDEAGRLYVASTVEHGIRVVEPDGAIAEFLALPGDGITTNCCFGGDDMRTLFATDAVPGCVVAWERMPTPGRVMHRWSGLSPDAA
jgi:gluconolactonase